MKKFSIQESQSSASKYLNKTKLYLLSIPFSMYKEYGQYKEDWESLPYQDIKDIEDTQKYFDNLVEKDETVRISYKSMKPWIQYGIKKICEFYLNHKEDFSRFDIMLIKEIYNEVS